MQPVEVAQQTEVVQPTVGYNVLPAEQTSEQVSGSAMNSSNVSGNLSEDNLETQIQLELYYIWSLGSG